ncbi:MAG: hydroxymethylbilane synthase, partial [Planctomycetales bacterium]|nr:hydroxymethylbilane synthase [Planctomycetales bacterium]
RGDRELSRPLPEIGGKGLFTAEIETALRTGDIDLAVHSFKDLPIAASEGLTIGAVLERAEVHDVLVSRHGLPLAELLRAPRIGTSSPRRAAQILAARPDAQIVSIRGNVDTRLRKA